MLGPNHLALSLRNQKHLHLPHNKSIPGRSVLIASCSMSDGCTLTKEEMRINYILEHGNRLPLESKSMELEPQPDIYIGNLNKQSLTDMLKKLAPSCPSCLKPRLLLCVENCCFGTALHCQACQQDDHFLHRTSDLSVLFVVREDVTTGNRLMHQKLGTMVEVAHQHILEYQKTIEERLLMIQRYHELIRELQDCQQKLKENDWLDALYRMVIEACTQSEVPHTGQQERHGIFETLTQRITMDYTSELLHRSQLRNLLSKLSEDKDCPEELSERWLVANPPSSLIESIVVRTCLQYYTDGPQRFRFEDEPNRSKVISTSEPQERPFLGRRLRVISSRESDVKSLPFEYLECPNVSELDTQLIPLKFPRFLRTLVLTTLIEPAVLEQAPAQLEHLSLLVDVNTSEGWGLLFDKVKRFERLKSLFLTVRSQFSQVPSVAQRDLFTLALQRNMRRFNIYKRSIFSLTQKRAVNPQLQICILALEVALNGVLAMHRHKYIRRMPKIYQEQLLELLDIDKDLALEKKERDLLERDSDSSEA